MRKNLPLRIICTEFHGYLRPLPTGKEGTQKIWVEKLHWGRGGDEKSITTVSPKEADQDDALL